MKKLLASVIVAALTATSATAEQWDGNWPPPEVITGEELAIGGLIAWWAKNYNQQNQVANNAPIYTAPSPGNLNTSGMNRANENFRASQVQGDNQIKNLLSGYPNRAYTVRQHRATYSVQNRDYVVTVPFVVSWNQGFVSQMMQTLNQAGTSYHSPTHWAFVNTSHSQSRTGTKYHFDQTRGDLFINTLYRAGPQVKVWAGNQSMGCWDIPELSGLHNSQTGMVQTTRNGVTIRTWLELQSSISFLSQVPPDNVRLEVVNQNQCL